MKGKRILLVWELGGGLGHAEKLARGARVFLQQGCEVVVALRNLGTVPHCFRDLPVSVLQAPIWQEKTELGHPIASLADVLLLNGYSDPEQLSVLVHAWRVLFNCTEPDLLICNYAPTALLAAQGLGMPIVLIENGMSLPVPGQPLQDWWAFADQPDLTIRQEARVLHTINTVRAGLGEGPLGCYSEIYAAKATLITTPRDFDPEAGTRRDAYYVDRSPLIGTAPEANWPNHPGPRIVAYLNPGHPALAHILNALRQIDAAILIVGPQLPEEVSTQVNADHIHLVRQFVNLPKAIGHADLVINHANMGSLIDALDRGKPVLALPLHLEQLRNAHIMTRLGLGSSLTKVDDPTQLVNKVNVMLSDASLSKNCRAYAERQSTTPRPTLERVLIDACRPWLANGPEAF